MFEQAGDDAEVGLHFAAGAHLDAGYPHRGTSVIPLQFRNFEVFRFPEDQFPIPPFRTA
jgi:hypothetical protein